jgi:hypothetical protein
MPESRTPTLHRRAPGVIENRDVRFHRKSLAATLVAVELGEDETVLLLSRQNVIRELNASAALLWEAMASGATVDELTAALTDVFAVGDPEAREAVVMWLADMRSHGLVE